VVELVRERRQRPAPGAADRDLVGKATGQRLGQHPARHPQQFHRRLPGAGHVRVIQHRQPVGDPRLECLQQRPLPSQCHLRRAAEDFTNRHSQLFSLHIRWGQLRRRGLNSGHRRLAQCTLLITAQYQGDQLLTASIGDQPDQPRQQIIYDKHASILPAGGLLCRHQCK
jgi:hypothetical protein